MCCIFCLSFRGLAYFGTSSQILLGLAIVIKYSTSLPDVKLVDLQEVGTGSSTSVAVLFTYGLLILIFGCFIFRGIEHESLRTLKVSVGGLTFLQCLVLVTHLVLISLTFDELKYEARMSQVTVLAVNLVLTFLQLTSLFLYMIQMAKRELNLMRSRNSDTSSSSLPLSATSSAFLKGPKYTRGDSNSNSTDSSGRNGRYSVGSSTVTNSSIGQRYVDGQWENLHV